MEMATSFKSISLSNKFMFRIFPIVDVYPVISCFVAQKLLKSSCNVNTSVKHATIKMCNMPSGLYR